MEQELIAILEEISDYFVSEYTPVDKSDQVLYSNKWHYVSFDLTKFLNQLSIIKDFRGDQKAPFRFLELGSGTGLLSRIFKGYFKESFVTGIELNAKLVDLSRKLFPKIPIIPEDALKFTGYADFNVIYYYRLFKEDNKQIKMEKFIENEITIGTYLICNFKNDSGILTDVRFKNLGANVFVKIAM